MCRFRHASGRAEPLGEIEGLANFLLFMQRAEDGRFELRFDAPSGGRSTPPGDEADVTAQARAALALCLAFRELGLDRVDFLNGARRALEALRTDRDVSERDFTAAEARWIVSALMEYNRNGLGPVKQYVEWADRIAASRRQSQLRRADVPTGELVGGTAGELPPRARQTADDLVVYASACMMGEGLRQANLPAARRAARYLLRLQYRLENSYCLADRPALLGAFRDRPDSRLVRLAAQEASLEGLVKLTLVTAHGSPGP
jgi:hypothetical protein